MSASYYRYYLLLRAFGVAWPLELASSDRQPVVGQTFVAEHEDAAGSAGMTLIAGADDRISGFVEVAYAVVGVVAVHAGVDVELVVVAGTESGDADVGVVVAAAYVAAGFAFDVELAAEGDVDVVVAYLFASEVVVAVVGAG